MSTLRTSRTFTAALLVVLLALAPAAPAAVGDVDGPSDAPPDEVGALADAYLSDQVGHGVVGVQAALVRDGRVVHVGAAGEADDGRPMTPSTPSRIESLSKSFTSLAVVQLVERGRVDLDRPVRDYLPELRIDDPRADGITVRQLLDQSSGLADATSTDAFPTGPRTLRERVALLRDSRLVAAPGTEFHYHNANYAILARMVEVVAGESFSDYLEQHVFDPLGMQDTVDTRRAGDRVPGMAQGHLLAFDHGFGAAGPDYFTEGSGGVVSTADDLGRWLVAQSGGGVGPDGTRIVSAAGVREMHRPQGPEDSDYGLGWYRAESAEGPPVRTSHSGAGAAFGAYQGIFEDSGWSVAVLVNTGAGLTAADPGVLGQNLLNAVDDTVPTLEQRGGGLRTDLVLTVLLLLTIAAVTRGLVRSRRWAERRRSGRGWLTGLRLALLLLPVAAVTAVPSVQLRLTDRSAPWPVLFTVEPVAVTWLLALGLGSAAVVAARTGWLVAGRRARTHRSRVARAQEPATHQH